MVFDYARGGTGSILMRGVNFLFYTQGAILVLRNAMPMGGGGRDPQWEEVGGTSGPLEI